jgi:maltose O-acetyltransferase
MTPFRKLLKRLGCEAKRWTAPGYVSLGAGCRVQWNVDFLHHEGRIIIGPRTILIYGCALQSPVKIGADCWINRDAYIRPKTTIGDRVNVGPFVRFITDSHEVSDKGRRAGLTSYKPIVVGDGVWIGAGVTILGGVTIGRGALIGAGSLVRADVPANTLVGGYPCRPIRSLNALVD